MQVPLSLFFMYRRGVFAEQVTAGELKSVGKIVLAMYLIELAGHAFFRYYVKDVLERNVGVNQEAIVGKQKTVKDFIAQKNYFQSKREGNIAR